MKNNYSFNDNIKKELTENNISPDNFEDAVTWLNGNGYAEQAADGDVASWFFFSQFLFLIVSMKKDFKGKTITVKKEESSSEVSYLAYALILYSTLELTPEAICIALKGKEYIKEKDWSFDSALSDTFQESEINSSWREAELFLFGYTKAKNIKKANSLSGLTTIQLLGTLKKNKIPLNRFISSNSKHSVYKNSSDFRIHKVGAYWDLVFEALHKPSFVPPVDKSRKTMMLTQGNLPNAVFVLYHYTLLWEEKLKHNGENHARLFFNSEIKTLCLMLNLNVPNTSDHFGIYSIFSEILSPDIFKKVISELYIAIGFTKSGN